MAIFSTGMCERRLSSDVFVRLVFRRHDLIGRPHWPGMLLQRWAGSGDQPNKRGLVAWVKEKRYVEKPGDKN